jgi:ABC-type amino acid transport substrate-binding protein
MRVIQLSSIVIVLIVSLVGCSKLDELASPTKNTVYDRVLKTSEIRVGYISYSPSFIKDPNSGELSGIFYEVIESAVRNMDIKLNYTEEVSWGTMIEALNTGRVDIVVTGIWPTSTRGKKADFTNPIYYSVVRAYTKAGNTSFDGNKDMINSNDITISTIDGEMTSIIASSEFPNDKI